jgi:hypothetical protein
MRKTRPEYLDAKPSDSWLTDADVFVREEPDEEEEEEEDEGEEDADNGEDGEGYSE